MLFSGVLLLLAATTTVFSFSIPDSPQVGIIGGSPVPISDVPYMVDLRYKDNLMDKPEHLCGGTILNERFILTAAHCCIEPNTTYTVAVGTDNVHEGLVYEVEKTIAHVKYTDETTSDYDYDICLVKLAKNITFGANITTVELADEHFNITTGMLLKATGWGFTKPLGPKSDILRQVTLPLVDHGECEVIYTDMTNITDRMICAGVTGKGVCHYDSGGPLVWKNKQVGITSFGKFCSHYPAVFVKISSLLSWIADTIASNK